MCQMRVCAVGTVNLCCAVCEWFAYRSPRTKICRVFCANTKRTGCAGCPVHAPGVLCSPQAHGKLINCVPLTRHTQTAQRVSGTLVYTKLNKIQRGSTGAGSSLQNLVFQKTRSRKSRFKQKPIFSITSWVGSWPPIGSTGLLNSLQWI